MLMILFYSLNVVEELSSQVIWEKADERFRSSARSMYFDSNTNLSYIYGNFPTFIGDTTNVVVYDGNTFAPFSKPPIFTIQSMINYKGKLFACGDALASWNGSEWEEIHMNGLIRRLKVYKDKLYAVGIFDSIDHQEIKMCAVWNDTVWSEFLNIDTVFAPESLLFVNDIEFYKGKVYLCGGFTNGEDIYGIMMHNSESWEPVGDFQLDGLGTLYQLLTWRDTLYVGGMMLESTGYPGNCIAAWDGETWHRLQDGINDVSGSSGDSSINDMRIINDELWVVGAFNVINGYFKGIYYGGVAKMDRH